MQSKLMRFLFIALLISGRIHAQQNTVTAGGEAVGIGGTSSYSIGQVFYTTLSGGNASAGAGVQQTYIEGFSNNNLKQYVLNVLSPNGDGKNDTWLIKNIDDFPNNTVSVYDRSGRRVFNEKSYKNTWNGTYNGTPLAQGVYFYVIEYGNGTAALKGALTILYRKN